VRLAAAADGTVIADAVLLVGSGAPPSNLLHVHADHLGTPQKLTDADQAIVWDGEFEPFGEEIAISGTAELPLRFPGQYADAETGYSYNYFRDYDPTIGRYLQNDPIGLEGGINTYAYVRGNPVNLKDPSGRQSIQLCNWGELCTLVGRVGPYCVYRCNSGSWVSTRLYPSGPCLPYVARGIGTSPWGIPEADMRKINITVEAVSLVEEWARWAETQIGPGFVPVVVWKVDDSGIENFVPELTLGFVEHDAVDRSRVMECEGKVVEIFQYVPDELFGKHVQKFIDVRDRKLILAEKP
jgi:RHS repeat-associated protein